MKRRKYLGTLTTLSLTTIAGCNDIVDEVSGDDELTVEEIKEEAESPSWEELFRNISEWEGEPVGYTNVHIVHTADTNGSFEFIIEHPDFEAFGDKLLFCLWDGDPFREGDDVDIWGIVEGTRTYTSTTGERTVPEIDLADVQLSN